MIDVILFSVFIGVWAAGLHIAAQDGMILNKPAIFLENKLGGWFAKPILTCAPCMCGLHGAIIWTLFCLTDFFKWDEYFFLLAIPPAIFIASITCMANKYLLLLNYEKEDLINQKHDFYHVDANGNIFE